jgi:hypothetical protein
MGWAAMVMDRSAATPTLAAAAGVAMLVLVLVVAAVVLGADLAAAWSGGARACRLFRRSCDWPRRRTDGERACVRSARLPAVISTPDLDVLAVAAAGVLCAFCCVVDTLPEQCLRRRPRINPLAAAIFRTKRLLRERCSATCPRRRRPGQVRHIQGGLRITAAMHGERPIMPAYSGGS